MTRFYNPRDWYWIVPGHAGEVYHSARRTFVPVADAAYVAFLADGNLSTAIGSEDELREVLAGSGAQYLNEAPRILELERPQIVRARCRVAVASFATANATPVAAPFNIEQVDPLGMHTGSQAQIVIGQTGVYSAVAAVRFLESSAGAPGVANTGMRAGQIRLGSTPVATTRILAAPADDTEFQITEYFAATEGDLLRLFVEQRCLGAMNAAARLTILRVE